MGSQAESKVPFPRLGPFEIVKPLATGGMAQIFLGRNLGSFDGPETVVIKAWHPPRATSPFETARTSNLLSRFIEEGRLGMRLKHPAIARSFGIMQDPALDLYFLVQEYVYGATLTELIAFHAENDLRIPYNVILKLMIPVVEALHYAYFNALREDGRRLRVIHRDIKPDNIMLGFDGRVRVLDFGVAKTSSLTRENTVGTMVVGTRHYMAPEQAYEPEKVGHHTDLFSAGLILYELCCLRSPFEHAGTIGDFARALKTFDFSKHAGKIDGGRYPGLREILTRALAVDISARYRSGADMGNDLRAMLELTPREPRMATFARDLKLDLMAAGIVKDPPFSTNTADGSEREPVEQEDAPTVLDISPLAWPGTEDDEDGDAAAPSHPDAHKAFPRTALPIGNPDPWQADTPRQQSTDPKRRRPDPKGRPDDVDIDPLSPRPPIAHATGSMSAWDDTPDPPSPTSQRGVLVTPAGPVGENRQLPRKAPRPPTFPPEFLPFAEQPKDGAATAAKTTAGDDLGAQPLSEMRSLWFEQPMDSDRPHTAPETTKDTPRDNVDADAKPFVESSSSGPPAPAPRVGEKHEPGTTERAPAGEPPARARGEAPLFPRFSWPSLFLGMAIGAAISSGIFLLWLR